MFLLDKLEYKLTERIPHKDVVVQVIEKNCMHTIALTADNG